MGAPDWTGLSPPYSTIVVDPPWPYAEGFPTQSRTPGKWAGPVVGKSLPYTSMAVEDIRALPVSELADANCRLFLWTTNRYLPSAFSVLKGWEFTYRQTWVWHKADGNMGGSVAPNSAEFLLVATRGTPTRLSRAATAVLKLPQSKVHSVKPSAFADLIEQVSPPPYVELFARQPRLGWDSWGHGFEATA